ncbi:MAG: hypothetical protein ACLR23_12600 [Clostridia bacterium]
MTYLQKVISQTNSLDRSRRRSSWMAKISSKILQAAQTRHCHPADSCGVSLCAAIFVQGMTLGDEGMKHPYGYFNESGTEFHVTNPETPRAFDNFLWNRSLFPMFSKQTGVGYCDYQIGDREAVQLLTGNGRVCDFDIFGRDYS